MKSLVRGFATVALMMLMIASFAGGHASASTIAMPTGATVAIAVQDFQFAPKVGAANVGDTVTWTNTGATAHTVSASDGSWDSGNLAPGASFSHTFTAAGTVNYYCKIHGSANGAGMAASIVIAAAGGSATPTTAMAGPTATAAMAGPTATTAMAGPTATAAMAMTPTAVMAMTPTAAASGMTASVTANDQATGSSITIAKVIAAQNGWITVHANTAANQPGAQLGHTAVKAGENDNVEVYLSPMPAAGDKVWPMLHIDAGVIGTYEFPGPDAPVIINGNIVMQEITLTAASSTSGGTTSGGTTSGGGTTTLPTTGSGPAVDLWLVAMLGLILVAGGALALRRRNA